MNLVHVPALHKPWCLNFLLHWTLLAELMIWLAAIVAFVMERRVARQGVAAA